MATARREKWRVKIYKSKQVVEGFSSRAASESEPEACTSCGTKTAFTSDWTLYPWPDGPWLCNRCNDERHEREDYVEVEAAARAKGGKQ